jgi:hypothetical protein
VANCGWLEVQRGISYIFCNHWNIIKRYPLSNGLILATILAVLSASSEIYNSLLAGDPLTLTTPVGCELSSDSAVRCPAKIQIFVHRNVSIVFTFDGKLKCRCRINFSTIWRRVGIEAQ